VTDADAEKQTPRNRIDRADHHHSRIFCSSATVNIPPPLSRESGEAAAHGRCAAAAHNT
jgi:hypothetical protein